MVTTPTDRFKMTRIQLDSIAWKFLRSEFTGQIYADRPIDRRIDAYLLHHGLTELLKRRLGLRRVTGMRHGQRRASFTQWSSSAVEHLGTPWRSSTLDDCRV
jgi:hypothetical protein